MTADPEFFCGVELAARLERVECGMLASAARSARAHDSDAGVFWRPLGGGVAIWTGPASPMNKVAGLGFGDAISDADLDEVEAAFRDRGEPTRVELSNLAASGLAARLTGRGYELAGFENVLGLRLPWRTPTPAPTGIDVARLADGEHDTWMEVVVDGFASPDVEGVPSGEQYPKEAIAKAIREMTSGGAFERYLARIDGTVVGGASLRSSDGVAQLAGAATHPDWRRRGVQTALLAHRLRAAADSGCDIAAITTEPGSRSQRNAHRHGFAMLYTRAILIRPLPAESG